MVDRRIKRSDTIFISSTEGEKEKTQYCPKCERDYKIKNQLHKRVYDLNNPNECPYGILPSDHEIWLQCHSCGTVYMKPEVKVEGELYSDIQIPNHTGILREDEHWEKPKHRRGFNERLSKGEDEIKDKDLKRELKKGAKLINYQES